MNKKALLKEIRKHPNGSKMLSLGYSPSFIHGLLLENEEQDQENNQGDQNQQQQQNNDQEDQNEQSINVTNLIKIIQKLVSSSPYKKQIEKLAFSYASYLSSTKEEDVNKRYEDIRKQLFKQLEKQRDEAIKAVSKLTPQEALRVEGVFHNQNDKFTNFNKILNAANKQVFEEIAGEGWPVVVDGARYTLPYQFLHEMFKGSKEIKFGDKPSPVLEPGQEKPEDEAVDRVDSLLSKISNQNKKELEDEIAAAKDTKNPEKQKTTVAAFGQAAPEDPKFNEKDVDAINKDPKAVQKVKQVAQQGTEEDPLADLKKKYDNSDFMKAVTDEKDKAVVYKFLQILQQGNLLSESIGDIVKALKLDKKGLTKAFAQLKKDEQPIIRKLLDDNSDLFIKMIQSGKASGDKTPKQQERLDNNKKQALGSYTEAYDTFNKRFMKETYLAKQGQVFDGLYQIILTLSDKQTEDIDREALAFSDANVEGADLQAESLLNEQDEEGILKLYQQGLIPQTNKMQRNTDKIMDILEEYQKYASGDKIKQGSKALFQKYGEMDPKKLLFKVLQMTMKDIATLEEMLDEYKAVAPDSKEQEDTDIKDFEQDQEKEEGEQEVIPEALIKEQKDVKQIIAEVKAVYFAVINPDTPGRALFTRARKTTTGEKRTDSPGELEGGQEKMEESILQEVHRLLKEDEEATNPDTQKNIKELALQVYEEMVKIRGYFPNVSPFGTDYGMDAAIKGLTKTLEGFNDLVLSINNKAKDKRVLGDVSELELKLKAIKENLKKYFGVSEYQKKAAKTGAMNDEGQKAVDQGKAEPTEDALKELTDADTLTANQKLPGFDGLVQQILAKAYTDDDVVNILAKFFESPDFMTKIRKGFNFIKSKLGLNENEEPSENEIRETFFKYMKLVLRELLTLQTKKGQPGIKKEIRKRMTTIANSKFYRKSLEYLKPSVEQLQNQDKEFNPSGKFKNLTSLNAASLKLMLKNFVRFYNRFRGQDKFKGVFVLYNLIQTIMLADVAEPDFDMAGDSATRSKKDNNKFLNKYTDGDKEKLKILQLFFDVYNPEDFYDIEDPSKLEEQIVDSVIRILLREDKTDADFLDKVKGAIEEDVAKRVLEDYKRFILKTKEIKDNPRLKKWLLSTLIQMATKDTSEFTKLLKPSDSDVYDQVTKEASLEDAIKDVSRQNKRMAELLNQFFSSPKDQEEGGDEDLPQNVQGAEDEYRRKTATDDIGSMSLDEPSSTEPQEDEPLEEKLRVSGYEERGDEAERAFFTGKDTFKLDKIKQIIQNNLPLPKEIKDYTINYFEKTKLDKKDQEILMYGISLMLKEYKELFVKTLSSAPSLKRATTKREMTEKQEEALKFFFTAYNNYKGPGSEERDTDSDALFTTPGTDKSKSFTRSTPKSKGEPESLELTGKKKFQENIEKEELIKILKDNLNKSKIKRVLYALKEVQKKYSEDVEIFEFVKQEVANQIKSGEFGRSASDVPDVEAEFDEEGDDDLIEVGEEEIENEIKKEVEKDLEGEDTSEPPSVEELEQMATELVNQNLDSETIENAEELNLDEKDLIQMAIDEFEKMYDGDNTKIDADDVRKILNSEFGKAIDNKLLDEFNKHDTYNEELHNFLRKRFRIVKEADDDINHLLNLDFEVMGPLQFWIKRHLKFSWSEFTEFLENQPPGFQDPAGVFESLYKYFENFIRLKDEYNRGNDKQAQEAAEDLKQTAEKLDDMNKEGEDPGSDQEPNDEESAASLMKKLYSSEGSLTLEEFRQTYFDAIDKSEEHIERRTNTTPESLKRIFDKTVENVKNDTDVELDSVQQSLANSMSLLGVDDQLPTNTFDYEMKIAEYLFNAIRKDDDINKKGEDSGSDQEPKKEPTKQSFAGNSEDQEYKLLNKSYKGKNRNKPDANFEKDLNVFSNFIRPFVIDRFLKEGPEKKLVKLATHSSFKKGSDLKTAYKKLSGSKKQAVDRMISAISGRDAVKYMTYITKNIKKEEPTEDSLEDIIGSLIPGSSKKIDSSLASRIVNHINNNAYSFNQEGSDNSGKKIKNAQAKGRKVRLVFDDGSAVFGDEHDQLEYALSSLVPVKLGMNADDKSKTKEEQIERKLERIIEHYLNTGRI